jgi:hypothetical protein
MSCSDEKIKKCLSHVKSGASMTPAPQYLITEDELKVWELCCEIIDGEFNTGTNDPVGKYLEVIKTIRLRPYTSASSDVLEELEKWGVSQYGEYCDFITISELQTKIEELRQQTKERP